MPVSCKIISVGLEGVAPLMFDRYAGDNETQLPVEQKMHFGADGRTLVLPQTNIYSFLTAENTVSAPRAIFDARKYKDVCRAIKGFVLVLPISGDIPILRKGKPIVFNGFSDGRDEKAGIYVRKDTARLKDGVPNPKVRPVIELPWGVEFALQLLDNDGEMTPEKLEHVFSLGGLKVGFGTFRGVYGKFAVTKWEVTTGK